MGNNVEKLAKNVNKTCVLTLSGVHHVPKIYKIITVLDFNVLMNQSKWPKVHICLGYFFMNWKDKQNGHKHKLNGKKAQKLQNNREISQKRVFLRPD